jgi:ATP-dependent Clp protease ATP-binding subunit ClpA
MFERFSNEAKNAVIRARDEAVGAGHDHLGCDHLLIGLIAGRGAAAEALTAAGLDVTGLRARLPGSPAAGPDPLDGDALASVGIDLDAVRRATEATFGPGALDRGRPKRRGGRLTSLAAPPDQDFKKSLELGHRVTVQLRQPAVTTGHLLIGLIDQANNAALDLLAAEGTDLAALRADVIARLAAAA